MTPVKTTHKQPARRFYIGLMSGTSADGVDAALVEFIEERIILKGFISPALPKGLKKHLIQLNTHPQISLEQLCQLSFDLAQQFARATHTLLSELDISLTDIVAIGSHGQTLYHAPHIPMSLQIGHPAIIAKQTGIQTVGDFRVDDMALGGQGAPFAPAFHQALFKSDQPCFVVNIGGIANVSFLPGLSDLKTRHSSAPLGFDTGPGNALMDEICQNRFDQPFDKNGELAQQGTIHQALLIKLLAHPYFLQSAPKSTGRETFNQQWLTRCIEQLSSKELSAPPISDIDLISTLCELTAVSIAKEIKQMNAVPPADTPVWIVGGGAYNTFLIHRIQLVLEGFVVQSSQAAGINPNAIEAMMFAWFAKQRLEHTPVALSQVTGAQRDAILGAVWLP